MIPEGCNSYEGALYLCRYPVFCSTSGDSLCTGYRRHPSQCTCEARPLVFKDVLTLWRAKAERGPWRECHSM